MLMVEDDAGGGDDTFVFLTFRRITSDYQFKRKHREAIHPNLVFLCSGTSRQTKNAITVTRPSK